MKNGSKLAAATDLSERQPVEIRLANSTDVPGVAVGVRELLVELAGLSVDLEDLEATALALIEDTDAGAVIVADAQGSVVGVLTVSWQTAMRIPGRYGLIQELWVRPSHRGQELGGELLAALCEHARQEGIARLEVGLPSERYRHLAATESFYVDNGFSGIGLRMRRVL